MTESPTAVTCPAMSPPAAAGAVVVGGSALTGGGFTTSEVDVEVGGAAVVGGLVVLEGGLVGGTGGVSNSALTDVVVGVGAGLSDFAAGVGGGPQAAIRPRSTVAVARALLLPAGFIGRATGR